MATLILNGTLIAANHESLTIDATAGGIGCTASKLIIQPTANPPYDPNRRAIEAFFTNETAQIRWTIDGTAPTAAVGHLLEIGDNLIIQGYQAILAFRGFRTGGSSATLKATYFFR